MKLKEALSLLAPRPEPQVYGIEIVDFELPRDGRFQCAQWLHPRKGKMAIGQDAVDEMRQFLSPGDVAIDIGAHTADTTLPMAIAVGKTGAVIALEPNPYVFRVLEATALLNQTTTNIIPLPFAATVTNGEFEFSYTDSGFYNGGYHAGVPAWRHGRPFTQKVQGRNLQQYLETHHANWLSRVRYVKVDTEGHDHAVLATLTGLLRQSRPIIKAEVFKHMARAQRQAFLAFLRELGYRVYIDEAGRVEPELTERNLMAFKCFDVFCVPQGWQRRSSGDQPPPPRPLPLE